MKKAFLSLVVLMAVFPLVAFGAVSLEKPAQVDAAYFTIQSVTVERVADDMEARGGYYPEPYEYPTTYEFPAPTTPGTDGVVTIDQVFNYAKQIWDVVVANKPVVNVTRDNASALPKGLADWSMMSGWQAPMTQSFRVAYKNGWGVDVVDFTYRVSFVYGGAFNGKGRYITNATIVPKNLAVAWGFTFTAQATVPSVTNAGTLVDPVAAMELSMHWSVDSVLRHIETTENFYIRGDGEMTHVQDEVIQ